MEKNYYPLRVDKKHGRTIVSDVDPQRDAYTQDQKEYEIKEYGGHIIAESLPHGLAQDLVHAYNEKYALKKLLTSENKPIILPSEIFTGIINGQVVCGIYRMYKIKGGWMLTKKDGYEYTFIGERYGNWVFVPVQIKTHQDNNSAHSFTEGSDEPKNEVFERENDYPTPSIDDQIEFIEDVLKMPSTLSDGRRVLYKHILENLLGIKRWSQNPLWSKLDVEKVIKDLVSDLRFYVGISEDNPNDLNSIQNAEAAIGMLQAFKEKREGVWTKESEYLQDRMSKAKSLHDRIVSKLMPKYPTDDRSQPDRIADAIIYAVEELIKLHSK